MENEIVFRLLLLLLLISFVAHRAYHTRKFARSKEDSVKEREGGTGVGMIANLLSMMALVSTLIYLINPGWIAWASFLLPVWLRGLGIVLALLGFALLQWAHHTLGKNWSDTPRLMKDQVLITNGPYHWIRHPIYTAFLLIMSAILLISANLFIGLSWITATLIEVISRVRYEEAIMIERFGLQYHDYMAGTGALFPRVF